MHAFPGLSPAHLLMLAMTGLAPLPAGAHAIVVDSAPAPEARLHAPTASILLRFNSRIDRERSRLTLLRPDGSIVALKLAPSAGPDTLAATAAALTPGRYRLRWQVLAIDGHITRGDIPFEVVP